MKHLQIAPAFAESSANQKAARKIDELLFTKMAYVFPSLKEASSNFEAQPGVRNLLVEPLIVEIKWIGGAARFWVGAMAGSSAVLIKVTFRDMDTENIIAEPEFYQSAGAYGGGWTVGGTDNRMLEVIADDIASYTKLNQ